MSALVSPKQLREQAKASIRACTESIRALEEQLTMVRKDAEIYLREYKKWDAIVAAEEGRYKKVSSGASGRKPRVPKHTEEQVKPTAKQVLALFSPEELKQMLGGEG